MGLRFSRPIETIFADKDRALRVAKRNTVQRTAEFARDRAAHHSPVAKVPEGVTLTAFIAGRNRRPGTLKKSWRIGQIETRTVGAGDRLSIDVYSVDPLAELIEFPTQPHIIVPRNANGVLAFPAGGRTVFARIVHHPGTRGAFMLTTALREADAEMEFIARDEIARWARGAYG